LVRKKDKWSRDARSELVASPSNAPKPEIPQAAAQPPTIRLFKRKMTMTHRALKIVAIIIPIALLLIPPLTNTQMLTSIAARLQLPRIFSHGRAMSTFKLDPTIFNASLYTRLRDVWFPGVDLGGADVDMSILKRWFMLTGTERDAFDGVCRAHFEHALDAIGPEKFSTPTAQPFIDHIAETQRTEGSEEAAWTALSITLLLDQIPRNIYRNNTGLKKVYTHYDAISHALSLHLLSSPPRVDLHPQWRHSVAHRFWFYMPLVHSEDLASHDLLDTMIADMKADCGAGMFIENHKKSAREHREILERFGRYSHRNEALGRGSTGEERAFLEGGGARFGVGVEK